MLATNVRRQSFRRVSGESRTRSGEAGNETSRRSIIVDSNRTSSDWPSFSPQKRSHTRYPKGGVVQPLRVDSAPSKQESRGSAVHQCNVRYEVSEIPLKMIKSAVLSASIFARIALSRP